MAEHKRGTMNIEAQEKVFSGFVRGIIWAGGISIGIVIFLAIFNS